MIIDIARKVHAVVFGEMPVWIRIVDGVVQTEYVRVYPDQSVTIEYEDCSASGDTPEAAINAFTDGSKASLFYQLWMSE